MIRRAAAVMPDARLDIEFADGHVGARADNAPDDATPREKSSTPPPPRAKQQKTRAKEDQGTLL
jgi:exodeoxyribonuclease VII large subunit